MGLFSGRGIRPFARDVSDKGITRPNEQIETLEFEILINVTIGTSINWYCCFFLKVWVGFSRYFFQKLSMDYYCQDDGIHDVDKNE